MFSNDSKVQLAVLQERFKAHEQIIDKVDTAIQTLSETNQNICKMLAVHDERLEQCKTDDGELCKKVEDMEVKIDNLYQFRWQIGGVVALAIVLIGLAPTIVPALTPSLTPATIERAK
jgi:chromosome segregation ATPase